MGSNSINYSTRAFAQDAAAAMKNDIVRGLIELITNSDDAYGPGSDGKIIIEVDHRSKRNATWNVTVADRAKGMSLDELTKAMGSVGSRTSGFEEGALVRGNLGRGAKDLAAFGNVLFETIKDEKFSSLMLEPDGTFDDPINRLATDDDRESLGVRRGNGTKVTVFVLPRFRCPRHENLLQRLSNHFQLRDINSDIHRNVLLFDTADAKPDTVRFSKPEVQLLLSAEVEIPGYEGATAHIEIERLPEIGEDGPSNPQRSEGLLVKGNKAIYENTLFGAENIPLAHWFTGSIRCGFIDQLAKSYDDTLESKGIQTQSNPVPIISRSRDGLEHEHPFYISLAAVVEGYLKPLIEEERQKSSQDSARESSQMRKALDELSRSLSDQINSDLEELDEDSIKGGDGDGDDREIYLIPSSPVLYMGENKTIAVLVKKSLGVNEVTISLDPDGVVEHVDYGPVVLGIHPRKDEYLIGQIRLMPLIENEDTDLTVLAGEHEATALVQVRSQRVNPEPVPPTTLEFERKKYSVTVGKKRNLLLRAPLEDVVKSGSQTVKISSDSDGVAVTSGTIDLEFDEAQLCFLGKVEIEPRTLGSTSTITAVLGDLLAECEVIVSRHGSEGPNIEIKISDDPSGIFRATLDKSLESFKITIYRSHKSLKRYMPLSADNEIIDTPIASAVIAEIVAFEVARYFVELKYQAAGDLDGPLFYSEHAQYLDKYINICHRLVNFNV
jgi:hypothetical protein